MSDTFVGCVTSTQNGVEEILEDGNQLSASYDVYESAEHELNLELSASKESESGKTMKSQNQKQSNGNTKQIVTSPNNSISRT